ncbi:aminoglycoside phosphotransferase family protein [Mycobacterium sp. MMS18-G62]
MTDDLADLAESQLERWKLRRDGEPVHGAGSIVVPVRTPEGVPAVLKLPEAEHGHLVLRRWGGDGAVRLLSADPPHRAVLLERLRWDSLGDLPDVEACEVVAGLYRRLHVPAMPQLPTLTSFLEQRARDFAALPRSAPIPHRLVEQAMTLSRELAADAASSGTVIHTNLHYENVLAAEREPWLAIAPKPMNGDPHYELAPMLWNRWDELTGDIREGVRRRFYTLVDAAGFDEERARAWVIVRVVDAAVRELATADSTKYVALAKAVQD